MGTATRPPCKCECHALGELVLHSTPCCELASQKMDAGERLAGDTAPAAMLGVGDATANSRSEKHN